MDQATPRIFISYSRTNSDFVDLLQADLVARNFDTWVDRRKLEGGQDWMNMIQSAIESSNIMLVVLSPEAIKSPYVLMEYRHALRTGKIVIPLHYEHIALGPIDLNDIQWIDFQVPDHYEQSLTELLKSLALVVPKPQPVPHIAIPEVPLQVEEGDEPDLVAIRPAPPASDQDTLQIYNAYLDARAKGDLDRAAIFLQQVYDREQDFNNGFVVTQLDELSKELLPIRLARLKVRAQKAETESDWRQSIGAWQAMLGLAPDNVEARQHVVLGLEQRALKAGRDGLWGEEIGAWEALLKIDPHNLQARDRVVIAEQNQRGDLLYTSARDFLSAGNIPAAQQALRELWRFTPYYGDPAGIAQAVAIPLPPTYESVILKQLRDKTESASAEGRWDDEVLAWQTILSFLPNDEQANEFIKIARQNQQGEPLYKKAVVDTYTEGRRRTLTELWKIAPYYGDPQGIAAKINIIVPSRYVAAKAKIAKDTETAKAKAEQDKAAAIARQQAEATRLAEDAAFKKDHPQAYYRKQQNVKMPLALISLVLLPLGLSFPASLISQSWIWGEVAVIVTGVTIYAFTYRKMIEVGWFLLMLIAAGAGAYSVVLLAQLDFFAKVMSANLYGSNSSQLWLFGMHGLILFRQILFGLLVGLIVSTTIAILAFQGPSDHILLASLGAGYGVALFAWLVIAFLGLFGLGLGFGYGWQMSIILALPFGIFIGTGTVMLYMYAFGHKVYHYKSRVPSVIDRS